MTDATPTRTRMTLNEFMALPESSRRVELIHGELITYGEDEMTPAPKDAHQRQFTTIFLAVGQLAKNGELRGAPTDVHLDDENVVQPDIFWVKPESDCTLGDDGYWHGAPDLVIEILSPATAQRDKGIKFDLYEKYGVREYWIADPEAHFFEVYFWQDGRLLRQGVFGLGESFTSRVLGNKTIDVSALLGK